MPAETQLWMNRVKAIEREYFASRLAIERMDESLNQDTSILGYFIQVRDVRQADVNLEGTYIIRIFAEFETGLRKFWNRNRAEEHKKQTPAEVLIDNVAAKAHVSDDTLIQVQTVRKQRNLLVHETESIVEGLAIGDVRSCLCTFLHNLYNIWK